MLANRIVPDVTPHFAASHLGLFRLPMSYKKERQAYILNDFSNAYSKYFTIKKM